ncbi:hypothetical protein DVH05_008528 [Phytophthora capsici]|nr:hypothetical protein DVH05_008528 [Phytophthora capsici]
MYCSMMSAPVSQTSIPGSPVADGLQALPDAPDADVPDPAEAFEALNSDCDETETEIAFYEDDGEWDRNGTDEYGAEDDVCSDGISDEEVNGATPISGDVIGDGVQTAIDAVAGREWTHLEKAEMIEFATSDENMAAMRANGWILGKTTSLDAAPYNMI